VARLGDFGKGLGHGKPQGALGGSSPCRAV
jgi:hypothetical protein